MKIKLDIGIEQYEEIKTELIEHGILIDDDADWILSENNKYVAKLKVKEPNSGVRVVLPVETIILIETFGHTVQVRTLDKIYHASERLYKILNLLDPKMFLRISNSAIISKNKVKLITPTLSTKFILTMSDGYKVDVTRSYYYIFREYFGI